MMNILEKISKFIFGDDLNPNRKLWSDGLQKKIDDNNSRTDLVISKFIEESKHKQSKIKRNMDDIDISNEVFNLFKKSGYSVESMATDEDGTNHKIVCRSDNRIITIYTADGEIVDVDKNELNWGT